MSEPTDPRDAFRVTNAPIRLPRWVFFLLWAGFGVFGFYATVSGTPTLDFSTPEGYVPIWASAVTLLGAAAFVSCLFDWWRTEMWTALGVVSFMLAYVYALASRAWIDGDPRAQAITVLVILVQVAPVGRFLGLASRGARLRTPPAPTPEDEHQ